MGFIDKADFKTGFWVGLGVVLAFMALGFVRLALHMVTRRRHG